MIPEQEIFGDEYRKVKNGFNFQLTNEELDEILDNILYSSDNEKLINITNFIYEEFPDIKNPDLADTKIKMINFKKELKIKAKNKVQGTNDFVEYLEELYPYMKIKSN